jgi:hypothetical protein
MELKIQALLNHCIDEGVKFALNDTEGMPYELDLLERLAQRISNEIWLQLDTYFTFDDETT